MVRIRLLGEQALIDDHTGRALARAGRPLALAGLLAWHAGSPQPRQRLAGLLWPDSSDAQALTNLRRELHALRRLLDDDAQLRVSATDLCWADPAGDPADDAEIESGAPGGPGPGRTRVDLREVEAAWVAAREARGRDDPEAVVAHARRGIEAYGGDFLPGLDQEWVLEIRELVRRHCADLCDLRAGTRVGRDRDDLAERLAAARLRITLQPLEEVGYRQLMALQAEQGDRGGLVSTYHHCAAVLERELGITPDATTRQALERHLARSGVLPHAVPGTAPPTMPGRTAGDSEGGTSAGAGRRSRPAGLPPGAGGRGRVRSAPLVGRDAVLRRLTDLWRRADSGRTVLVVVRGPAGVGKTRLAHELARLVRAGGGAVAAAQCFDLSGRLAMAPVAAWLRQPVLAAATRSLEPVWRREVQRLVPDDAHQDPGSPAAVGSGERAMVDAWQRQRFFEGLAQAVLRVEQPLLLVLDDVQWCDQQTLSWLSSLQALAPRRRLMVVLTLREPDAVADEDVLGWVSRQRAAGILAEVTVAALSIEETGTLAASLAGRRLDPVQVAVLHATTGGFPLFVVEAVRSRSADPTPPAAVLRRRLDQLSPDARDVAALASALPRDVTLDLLSEASDLDAVRVTGAVDELWRARILREVGAGYAFSHDLLRAAAYDRISPPRRWLLHRRLAQALELAGGTYGDDVAGLLADQYDRGGRPDRALNHYTEAATIAAGRFALPEAVRLLREAQRVTDQLPAGRYRDLRELDVLLAMAAPLTAWRGYASAELQRVLERAVDLARETAPASTQMQGLMALWASRFVQGRVGESHRLIRDALTIAVSDDVLLGEAHFAYAGSTVTLGHPAEAIEHFDIAHERCAGAESLVVGTHPDVHALAWSAHAHWLVAQPDTAAARASAAVRRARELGHPYSLAVAIAYGAVTQQLLGERTALRRAVRELAEVCERYGFAYYREWGLVLDGWLRGGPEGLALARRGVANLRVQNALVRMPYWLGLLADLQCDTGQTAAAAATLDAARSSAQTLGDAWWLPEVLRQRAALAGPHQRASLLAAAVATAEDQGSLALAARVRRTLGETGLRTPRGTPAGSAPNAARTARS